MLKENSASRDLALQFIYRQSRDKVCSFILSNKGSKEDALDIFQETIIAFYENVQHGKFRADSAITSYLYAIARFKWLNELKKRKVTGEHQEKALSIHLEEADIPQFLEKEKEEALLKIFDLVGESCKQLLIQVIYYNASMKEVMEKQNFSSEQIVRNKKYKCLQKLKSLMLTRPDIVKFLRGHER